MSFINDIRNIQAETIVKHEEEMRRDRDIVLKVVHIIKDRIKAKVSNYLYAKDETSEEVKFIITDMLKAVALKTVSGEYLRMKEKAALLPTKQHLPMLTRYIMV